MKFLSRPRKSSREFTVSPIYENEGVKYNFKGVPYVNKIYHMSRLLMPPYGEKVTVNYIYPALLAFGALRWSPMEKK